MITRETALAWLMVIALVGWTAVGMIYFWF